MQKEFFKNHKWAILFALICAIIISFPQLYFRYDPVASYQGIDIHGSYEEELYMNRIREVQDGNDLSLSCPFLKTNEKFPYMMPPLGEIITGFIGKILFLDIRDTILFSRFFFPLIAFFLVYFFIFSLCQDKLAALAGASLALLGRYLISARGLITLIQGENLGAGFLQFFRPVHPQVSSLFFFGFLLFFWLFFIKKQKRWGVTAAILLGASFYTYPFLWIFLCTFCGILMLILFFQKNFKDLKRVVFLFFGGILIGVPYFFNLYKASLHPIYSDIIFRLGLIETHKPFFHFLLIFFIIFLILLSKKWKERYVFSLALLLTPFIVLNQHVITGQYHLPFHYHWYYNIPLAFIFLTIIFFEKLKEKGLIKFRNIMAFFIIGLSIFNGISVQKNSYEKNRPEAIEEQRYATVVDWLNKNAEKNEVVFTPDNLAGIVLTYTSLNVHYFYPWSFCYFCSSEEYLLENIFLIYRLDGLKTENAREVFFRDRKTFSYRVYGVYYGERESVSIPDEKLDLFVKKYKKFLTVPLEKIWEKQQADYLIWDKKYHPDWNLGQYSFLNEVHEKNNIKIYKMNSDEKNE